MQEKERFSAYFFILKNEILKQVENKKKAENKKKSFKNGVFSVNRSKFSI